MVRARMFFSSSSPIPSENLVLITTQTLLSGRQASLTGSADVPNFTYMSMISITITYYTQLLSHCSDFISHSKACLLCSSEITDTSYTINFTFNIRNISMPENHDLRNNTYNQVKSIINNYVSVYDRVHTVKAFCQMS